MSGADLHDQWGVIRKPSADVHGQDIFVEHSRARHDSYGRSAADDVPPAAAERSIELVDLSKALLVDVLHAYPVAERSGHTYERRECGADIFPEWGRTSMLTTAQSGTYLSAAAWPVRWPGLAAAT